MSTYRHDFPGPSKDRSEDRKRLCTEFLSAAKKIGIDTTIDAAELINGLAPERAHPLESYVLRHKNYQVIGDYSCGAGAARRIRMVVDSGAGPNLVHSSILPGGWERLAHFGPQVNIRGANGKALRTRGQVKL